MATRRVSVELGPSAAVVSATGDVGADIDGELREALDEALAWRPTVIVDLAATRRMDPAGLGTLVRARNAARRRDGELVLAAPSRFQQTVLRTMRLHTAFRTFGTLQQAVTATRPPAGRGGIIQG